MTEADMFAWATDLHHKYGICWPVDESDDKDFTNEEEENYEYGY